MAEDIAQTVLCSLVRNLQKLDPDKDLYAYICSGVVNTWRRIMRGRRAERKYLLAQVEVILAGLPPAYRSTARGQAIASWEQVSGLKYYA